MDRLEWARREIEIAKLAEHETVTGTSNEDEMERILNRYMDSVFDSVLELIELFAQQNHSGYSASFVASIFQKLVDGKPIKPLTGDEEEWDKTEHPTMHQNKRMWSLFRIPQPEGGYKYKYNDILLITNSNEPWARWSEPGNPGYIDDEKNTDARLYFEQKRALEESLEETIKFPYTPVSYIYEYDFKQRAFKEIGRKQ